MVATSVRELAQESLPEPPKNQPNPKSCPLLRRLVHLD